MAEELHAESGAWLAEVDLVISAVFGGVALDVARQSLPSMHKGAIYADFTTASPAALFDAGQLASEAAIQFVDVAIAGAISLGGSKRSEARRVGKEWVRTCRSRWW